LEDEAVAKGTTGLEGLRLGERGKKRKGENRKKQMMKSSSCGWREIGGKGGKNRSKKIEEEAGRGGKISHAKVLTGSWLRGRQREMDARPWG